MVRVSRQTLALSLLSAIVHGFVIYDSQKLDVTLGEGCINSLSANINCADYVQTFMMLSYRGSLENVTMTDTVCTSDCSGSLKNWFDSVSKSCAGKTLNDAVPMKFGGYMWAGFNETCVKDPKTKQYCNDIIAKFTNVDNITKMPQTELCHTCNVRRLSIMQSSQYSIYDSFYKTELEYVYAQCGLKGPTDIPPPLTATQPDASPYCVTGKRYTTKKGDTCESIANSTSVSAAALYMGNQAILPDCRDVDPGANLCIPMTCQTYYVTKSDTCASIESALGIEHGMVRSFNSWLKSDCSNLQPATDFYGKIICVSPQGGTFTGTFPPPAPTSNPGLGDGYTRTAIPPPEGATVAPGTTLNCGKWYVVKGGDACSKICIQAGITSNLFRQVNPSLKDGSCDALLKPQSALCVGPTYSWNTTLPGTTSIATATFGLPTGTNNTATTKSLL
ncbi:uncharacterized protein BDR25DRAFT_237808 [Lindgomyces ingoldianus]|uniref:Uncharacterized protein n=1 Tax=Lindgomyces ingoldianus TaxID=673940 RepID=A0ACB6QIH8_9PLEO|nr:uncharacterized protein BDR25DRAFT_237808 [Lindgomyces ingoldianus]KAF2466137.1 hypothetical protein BDR25DRAFT_237808 [Lindgomyces ingoldianus]